MADKSITVANVLKSANGVQITGIIAAATTITQGQALYLTSLNTLGLADSNGSSPANTFAGFSLSAGTAGQPVVYVPADSAYVSGASLTSGDRVYLSNTAGGITTTIADLAAGSTVIVLGVANSDGTLNVAPITGGTI